MALHQIDAILWRSFLTSTSDALWGTRKSQYYIDLPAGDYETFFSDHATQGVDPQGNTTYSIWLEPFDGSLPVEKYQLTFKKLRQGVEREGSWNINDQSPQNAYPLWQKERGPASPYQQMADEERKRNFLVVARDKSGRFYGRWLRGDDFDSLPAEMRDLLKARSAGWSAL